MSTWLVVHSRLGLRGARAAGAAPQPAAGGAVRPDVLRAPVAASRRWRHGPAVSARRRALWLADHLLAQDRPDVVVPAEVISRQAVVDASARQPPKQTDLRAELAAERRRSARLQQQVDAMVRIVDLSRRKAQRLERQLEQQRRRADPPPRHDSAVLALRPQD